MGEVLDHRHLKNIQSEQRCFIRIPALSIFPELIHGFTTRFGGVSTGDFATLNLNFNRPDPKPNVIENYRRLGQALAVSLDNMVLSYQVHDNKVIPVSSQHRGMGIAKERTYRNVDGLATQEKDLLLVTHYADCVPLYFYDPVLKVIALSHSGWKGTLLDIAGQTVSKLKENYGCQPHNLHMAFGPHIRACCFEVGDDVAHPFRETFPWAEAFSTRINEKKWLLDLEGIITQSLLSHGLVADHITGCDVCTRCHSDLFFSHRGSGGKTGTGAAFMMIRGHRYE